MLTVTKRFEFCYAHNLPKYAGKCSSVHGHNSTVEVTFEKPYNHVSYPGMVIDFSDIKKFVKPIIDSLDHKFLNKDVYPFTEAAMYMCEAPDTLPEEELKKIQHEVTPTAENIATFIVTEIQKTPIGEGLVRVRVYETPDNWAEWDKRLGIV